jgi:hypothetical protein
MHNSKADLKRNTTDKISARSIAEYLIAHPDKVPRQQPDQWAGPRKQWSFIRMLNKQCTQLLNQLESLLYTSHPGLLGFCRAGVPQWVLKLRGLNGVGPRQYLDISVNRCCKQPKTTPITLFLALKT